jgi:hypothetical protein
MFPIRDVIKMAGSRSWPLTGEWSRGFHGNQSSGFRGGRTTLDECRRIIDRLEEFAALLSSQWSEFSFLVTVTDSASSET